MTQNKKPGVGPAVNPTHITAKQVQTRQIETIDAFAKRTGVGTNKAPDSNLANIQKIGQDEGARPRTKLSTIQFPRQTGNMAVVRLSLRIVDAIFVTAVILISIWGGYIGTNNNNVLAPLVAGLSGALGFFATLYFVKAHHFSPSESYSGHMKRVILGAAAALGVWMSIGLILKPDTFIPDALAISGLLATATLVVLHSFYFVVIKHQQERGQLIPTIVMLGATETARRLIEENARTRELNILAIFDERLSRAPHNIHGVPVVGRIEDMLGWDALPYVDRIIVTLPGVASERKKAFVQQVRKLPNRISFVVDEFEHLDHVQQRLSQIAEIGMSDVTNTPFSGGAIFVKRFVDIAISGTALLFGAPVLAIIALAIKLDSPGPVLFKQQRQGFNNRVFDVFKFRSLKVEDEDKTARSQVTKGDNRVTRVGRFIRKTSLDELPQLLNVLKGDMSLVGPRPHAVGMHTGDIETYKLVDEYAHRLKMKPGLTGWAQINGSRGPLHDAEGVARRVQLDIEYIERSSVLFDLMIMVKTLPCLLGDSENDR